MSRSRHRLRSAEWYEFAGLYRADWRDNQRWFRQRRARAERRLLWRTRELSFPVDI